MALASFLGKLKGSDKEEPQKFLALILTDEVVQAAVWSVIGEVTEIVALGTPVEWDGDTGTTTELVTAVDATISSATEGLESEVSSVILGIPHSWTDKNGILGVKKEFISKIRKELELEAIGYVVITDSILSYLKMQEGTPTTSIIIQVSRDELTLVLVRLGRIEAIETIGRSDDVVDDVTEGIARFKAVDNLPSRIILFNSMHNLDDIIQNLLSVDWQSQFSFLHLPKIEALAKDVAIRALVVAGGSEVAKSLGFAVSEPVPAPSGSDLPAQADLKGSAQPADTEAGRSDPIGDSDPSSELLSAEEIGFTSPVEARHASPAPFIDPDDEPETQPFPITPGVLKHPLVLPTIKLPKFHLPKFKLNLKPGKPLWWYLGGGFIALGLFIFYLVWILPSSTLTIRVTPKILEENVELTLSSSDTSIDFAGRVVPANIESISESGQKIMETTGKKTIGDPASGEVTIYNRTSANKTFTKGTSLSSGSLKFSLDSDVSIASKSAGSDYVDVPGKSNVAITAVAIGKDSNLPSGTEFSLASFGKDSYVAKNDTSLSGGTSEEVQVVGKDDQKNLVKSLTEEILSSLTTKAIGSGNPGSGVYLVPDSSIIDSASYSAKVGEPAKSLSVDLTLKASLLRYQTDDVETLVNSSIDQAIPAGYVRANLPSTVELSASSVSESGDNVKGNAKVKVSLLPVIDSESLRSSLAGKSGSVLESILSTSIPGYISAEARIFPIWIPARLKGMPHNSSKININLVPSAL
jgi:hypothetical protein